MYKITNIELLGTDYTVADSKGNVIKTIQIVPATEILDTALGEYNIQNFTSYRDYLDKSIATMTGFEKVDPNRVLWYATSYDEVVLSELIEYAVKNGYDKIILEHLEPLAD
jgi:hypothetical protein